MVDLLFADRWHQLGQFLSCPSCLLFPAPRPLSFSPHYHTTITLLLSPINISFFQKWSVCGCKNHNFKLPLHLSMIAKILAFSSCLSSSVKGGLDPLLAEFSNQVEHQFFLTQQPAERLSDGVSGVWLAELHSFI